MKPSLSSRRVTPALSASIAVIGVVLGSWCIAPEMHSQAPALSTPNTTLLPLMARLKTQQAQITANQTKIEAQTALLKEDLRQAKIYSARGGSGHR